MAYQVMIGLGGILLVSLMADWLASRINLPRVTILVIVGIGIGPYGLSLMPGIIHEANELITSFALSLVAFLLGSELSADHLRRHGAPILILSVIIVIATGVTVGTGLLLIGAPVGAAILLGAISTATDPAATQDVVAETRAKGRYRDILLGIVAIDDAWGLIAFGIALAAASALMGDDAGGAWHSLAVHLGGALFIGVATGIPMALLSGRVQPGRPNQLEAIGFVLVCSGLALWVGASYLLAATVMGTIVANFARHHDYTFRQIERFEWPFVTVFFVLAGAMLDVPMMLASGVLGLGYVAFRVLGRFWGGYVGATIAHTPPAYRTWLGIGLLPQAGVAVGMALLVANEMPEIGEDVLAITIGATVFFEIIGPVITRLGIARAGAPPNTSKKQKSA